MNSKRRDNKFLKLINFIIRHLCKEIIINKNKNLEIMIVWEILLDIAISNSRKGCIRLISLSISRSSSLNKNIEYFSNIFLIKKNKKFRQF